MDILTRISNKNWSRREIDHYQRILYRGDVKRSALSRALYVLNYVLVLGALIIGNLCIAFVLMPLFIIADELFTAFFLIFFGILFGLFSDTLIYHIESPSDNYYAIVAGFLPIVTLGVYALSVFAANFWAGLLQLPQGIHSPLYVSIIYNTAYLLPFFYHVYKRYYEKKDEALIGPA